MCQCVTPIHQLLLWEGDKGTQNLVAAELSDCQDIFTDAKQLASGFSTFSVSLSLPPAVSRLSHDHTCGALKFYGEMIMILYVCICTFAPGPSVFPSVVPWCQAHVVPSRDVHCIIVKALWGMKSCTCTATVGQCNMYMYCYCRTTQYQQTFFYM